MVENAQDFWVRFWGVRGSVPCPGPGTVRYGGNTSCIEVCCGADRLIFDAGTGLRAFGASLGGETGLRSHIFLSHTHIDHINGFPFFRPAYDPDNRFEVWAGHLATREGGGLQTVLSGLMSAPLFPVPIDIMHACIAFNDFKAGETLYPIEGVTLRTTALNHPQGATGYRVEFGGKSICYITDTEHRADRMDQNIIDLIRGSDVVIYDATYTELEHATRYAGWGHSTWNEGVRLCDEAGVSQFVAFHHDPDHDDDFLDRMAEQMDQARPGSVMAAEGMIIQP
jgi:phosphoribosyl 1,2-cyclic phosphodiesterase